MFNNWTKVFDCGQFFIKDGKGANSKKASFDSLAKIKSFLVLRIWSRKVFVGDFR